MYSNTALTSAVDIFSKIVQTRTKSSKVKNLLIYTYFNVNNRFRYRNNVTWPILVGIKSRVFPPKWSFPCTHIFVDLKIYIQICRWKRNIFVDFESEQQNPLKLEPHDDDYNYLHVVHRTTFTQYSVHMQQ